MKKTLGGDDDKSLNNRYLDDYLQDKFRPLRKAGTDQEFAAGVMRRIDVHESTLAHTPTGQSGGRERPWVLTFAVLIGAMVCLPSVLSVQWPFVELLAVVTELFIAVDLQGLFNEDLTSLGTLARASLGNAAYTLLALGLLLPLLLMVLEE